jgi:hypothetical protein
MVANILKSRRMACFAVLSATDLVLTFWLLQGEKGVAYEANPLAAWWLGRFGWAGLAAFKLGTVVVVGCLLAFLLRRRPLVVRRVLTFGCAALVLVVLYSASLVAAIEFGVGSPEGRELVALDAASRNLRTRGEMAFAYTQLLHKCSKDLIAGRTTLHEAATQLEAMELTQDPSWGARGERAPHALSVREQVELQLGRFGLGELRNDPRAARAFLARLRAERPDGPWRDLAAWLLPEGAASTQAAGIARHDAIPTQRESGQ